MGYELIDSGDGKKLERFGDFVISRPASQAVWEPQKEKGVWDKASATFSREPQNTWNGRERLPESWNVTLEDIIFELRPTDFGHLGVFPEHAKFWPWIQEVIRKENRDISVLNLFAYSGGATLAAALAGASVCHVDASKGMISWAQQNAKLNGIEEAPIRWIIDDVMKFLGRELRRGRKYDAIICDPPSFGRGAKGEVFKIEDNINQLIHLCYDLLSDQPLFFLLSCHTPGYSPIVMNNLLSHMGGKIDFGEMSLVGNSNIYELPSGTYGRWVR